MIHEGTKCKGLIAAGVAAVLGLTAAAAGAQTTSDPLTQRAEAALGPGEFLLTSEHDSEVLTYDEKRDLRVCNRTRQLASESGTAASGAAAAAGAATSASPREAAVPLQVEHDGTTARVSPGECQVFQAQRLSISPAEELEQGWLLRGSVESHTLGSLSAQATGGTTSSGMSSTDSASTSPTAGTATGSTVPGATTSPDSSTSGSMTAGSTAADSSTMGSTTADSTATGTSSQSTAATTTPAAGSGQAYDDAQKAIRDAQQALRQAQQALNDAERELRQAEEGRQRQAQADEDSQRR